MYGVFVVVFIVVVAFLPDRGGDYLVRSGTCTESIMEDYVLSFQDIPSQSQCREHCENLVGCVAFTLSTHDCVPHTQTCADLDPSAELHYTKETRKKSTVFR